MPNKSKKGGVAEKGWPQSLDQDPGGAAPTAAEDRPGLEVTAETAGSASTPQGELNGVVPEMTRAQAVAMTLVEERERLDVIRERVKKRELDLVAAMHQDQVSDVKVRDGLNRLHLFELETLVKIRHREG